MDSWRQGDRRFSDYRHMIQQPHFALRSILHEMVETPDAATRHKLRQLAEDASAAHERAAIAAAEFAYWASSPARVALTPCALKDVVEDGLRNAVAVSSKAGLAWRVEIADTRVMSAPEVLSSVIDAVALNAAEFTQAGAITVAAGAADGALSVIIADEGPGLAPGFAEALGAPFLVDPSRPSRAMLRFGLGFATARLKARALGGALTLSNRTDQCGAVCRLTTPG